LKSLKRKRMGPVLTRGRVTQPGRRVSVGEAPFGGHPAERAGVHGCGTLAVGWSASVGPLREKGGGKVAGRSARGGLCYRPSLIPQASDRGEVCSACLWLGSVGLSRVTPRGTGTVPRGAACEWVCIHMRAQDADKMDSSDDRYSNGSETTGAKLRGRE